MHTNYQKITQWYTQKLYVDLETGEVLTETDARKHYYEVKLKKIKYVNNSSGTVISIHECRRTGQTTIGFKDNN